MRVNRLEKLPVMRFAEALAKPRLLMHFIILFIRWIDKICTSKTALAQTTTTFALSTLSSSTIASKSSRTRRFLVTMSWKLGKKSPKSGADGEMGRSTTPTPGNPNGNAMNTSGMLAIRIISAEGLGLPAGTTVPPAVQSALDSSEAKVAASVSPSSVTQQRLAKGRTQRDSVQRTQCWWLPYLVLEFDVNQVLITPLGGSIESPVYMYLTHLSVCFSSVFLSPFSAYSDPFCYF